jgi:uncharacterized repeat protein (TIGR02543 family)
MIRRTSVLFILGFACLHSSITLAQDRTTVKPVEYPGALSNPLKGFRYGISSYSKYDYSTLIREYIKWKDIENSESDGVDKIKAYCNSKWAGLENSNIKVIPRVYLDWDSNPNNEYWPADLTNGDWKSAKVKDRLVKLIYKLGQAWDNDPRIAWVQTGLIGYWGEQESPVGVGEDGWAARLGKAYQEAFPNKLKLVRNQQPWDTEGFKFGVYWDSFAHPGQKSGSWTSIKKANDTDGRYKNQVVEGEVAYNWGQDILTPVLGATPDATISTPQYYNYLIDVIKELHCSALGWVSDYSPTDPKNTTGAMEVQKAFGYQFVLSEFSCSKRANQGSKVSISFKVINKGSAPFYENWPLAFVLIDETTRKIVFTEQISGYDIRGWLPGDNYNNTTRSYTIPAIEYTVDASITVPSNIATGQYMAGVTILEPYSRTPGVFFSVKNFLKESQTQPLCRIGIGQDVIGDYGINPSIFSDPVKDDARSYTLEWKGSKYNLTISTATGGSVSPGSGVFYENQKVYLKATAQLGFEFTGWSGDVTGTDNPILVTMDKNKSATANFKSVATYTLATTSSHGTIVLDPPGGVYNVGTVVKLTVTPNLGYLFTGWSGDLSGTTNPATITINANKSVTAVFGTTNVYSLTTTATGGTIIVDPPGPQYNAGTRVKVEAKANAGYLFRSWSGDPLDDEFYVNPNYVTMNSNKNIIAEFRQDPSALNLIKNGDFSSGMNLWNIQVISPAAGTISAVNQECKVEITAVDGQTWHINILQPGIKLETNTEYTFSFDARATAAKSVEVMAQFDHSPWTGSIQEPVTISTSMRNYSVTWLQKAPADYYKVGLFFGSDTTDVWVDNIKLVAKTSTDIKDERVSTPPTSTCLRQNYPNPFNPSTTISYQLEKATLVKLGIYNLLGQNVAAIVDAYQPAGEYSVKWNARDSQGNQLASGIYFYRIETENFVQNKKLSLIR